MLDAGLTPFLIHAADDEASILMIVSLKDAAY